MTYRRKTIHKATPDGALVHSDFDDFYDRPLVLDGLTVFELEDLPPVVSKIVQANGDPIIYFPVMERQPWIGFLKPAWVDEEYEFSEDETETDDDAATE